MQKHTNRHRDGFALVEILVVGAGVLLMTVMSGCSTPGGLFSAADDRVRIGFTPSFSLTPEAALGVLKNLQSKTFTVADRPITKVDVNSNEYRASAEYAVSSAGSQHVPSYGAVGTGDKQISTYRGISQPWEQQEKVEALLVIPFKQVNSIEWAQSGTSSWWVVVHLQGGKKETVAFHDQASAREFSEAVASLAKAQGWTLSP